MASSKVTVSILGAALVLVILSLHESSAVRFYTRYNQLCQTKCATNGRSYYWCWTGRYTWSWDYCSPRENVDRYGTSCRSNHQCGKHGRSYNWCYLDSANNWEYCGKQTNNFEIVSSTGYFCTDDCAKRGGSYFWCHTDRGWGYCSPEVGKDYYDRRCDAGSYCSKTGGTSYYWCSVNRGSTWGYCSIKGESKDITSYGYYCSTECQYDRNAHYFWCRKFNGYWDYCSPIKQIDAHGRSCYHSDCSKSSGTSYYWCYYNTHQWDYCGIESLNNNCPQCSSGDSKRQVRQNSEQCEIVRNVIDRGNNLEVQWQMENNNHISRNERRDYSNTNIQAATSAIAQFNGVDGAVQQRNNLVTEGNVRIDLQGRTPDGYANIQIQVNRPRSNRPGNTDPTTIATALIQTDRQGNLLFPIRYVRHALLRSLRDCQPRQCRLQRRSRS